MYALCMLPYSATVSCVGYGVNSTETKHQAAVEAMTWWSRLPNVQSRIQSIMSMPRCHILHGYLYVADVHLYRWDQHDTMQRAVSCQMQ